MAAVAGAAATATSEAESRPKSGYPGAEEGMPATSSAQSKPKPCGQEAAKAMLEFFFTPEFWEKHWEKYPLHLRAADGGSKANLLPDALSVDNVADLIRRSGGSLKMFKKGDANDEENFLLAYLDGGSLVVNQAERYEPTVYDMCQVLADKFFHHVFAVAYLTPVNSYAVRLHNDDQDVFLLQVWGKKHWIIRDAAPRLITYTEEMLGKDEPVPAKYISEPIMSFDMEPGDILYMPRGFLHEATTSEEPSLHITITMPTSDYCWGVQCVKHLMQEVHSPSLPPPLKTALRAKVIGPDRVEDDEQLDAHIQEVFKNWQENISLDGVLDAFEQRMERVNSTQERTHKQAMSLQPPRPQVTEDSRVRLMHGCSCWCEPDSEVAVFKRDTQRMELHIAKTAAPLIRSLTSRPQNVRDLPCEDKFERLCLLQMLHSQDVLQLFTRDADEKTI